MEETAIWLFNAWYLDCMDWLPFLQIPAQEHIYVGKPQRMKEPRNRQKNIAVIKIEEEPKVEITKIEELKTDAEDEEAPKTRKRRRADKTQPLIPLNNQSVVGPTTVEISIPNHISDCCQCVVNAISSILPIDATVNLLGYAHKVILIGVMYKYNNLTWIILNRLNNQIYNASHFVADTLHLFTKKKQLLDCDVGKKFHRQGINEIITLPDPSNVNKRFKLNSLSKNILKFNPTLRCFNEVKDFLRCVGPHGSFLTNYKRTQTIPTEFAYLNQNLCAFAKGWKVFKRIDDNGACKRMCECSTIQIAKEASYQEQIASLISQVPSSLVDTALQQHYAPFIQYLQKNPNLFFYPQQDVIV